MRKAWAETVRARSPSLGPNERRACWSGPRGGALPQRERGPEWIVVLVSERFDGVPWLERVHVCGALWDAAEMGAPADMHCYTPAEFERKCGTLRRVADTAREGIDLLTAPA